MFMRTWNSEDSSAPVGQCRWKADMDDARSVCETLGIGFEVVNMIGHYRQLVVDDLVDGYRNGMTPNPDVLCNARIKFGVFKKYAMAKGFDKFATGHYCRSLRNGDGSWAIFEGADKNKDQSYFLAMLSQEQIGDALFPVGDLRKSDVRKLAERAGLCTSHKRDSQGICFLGKVKIQDFLAQYITNSPGEIVDCDGKILGRHGGLFRFTIGQRRGINLPSNQDCKHYVVVAKDLERNRLIVEIEGATSRALYGQEFFIHDLSFIGTPLGEQAELLARPRYRDPAQEIIFSRHGKNGALVVFKKPQRAIAPGQIIAFYGGEQLIGGGIFG
jgi:tRNA-specific 2-thiouridylase